MMTSSAPGSAGCVLCPDEGGEEKAGKKEKKEKHACVPQELFEVTQQLATPPQRPLDDAQHYLMLVDISHTPHDCSSSLSLMLLMPAAHHYL